MVSSLGSYPQPTFTTMPLPHHLHSPNQPTLQGIIKWWYDWKFHWETGHGDIIHNTAESHKNIHQRSQRVLQRFSFVCLFAFGSHHHLLPFIFGVWKGRSPFQLTGPSLSCLKDLSRDLLVNIFLSFPEKFSCLPFSPSWTFRQTNEQRKEKRKKKDSLKLTLPLLRKHWEPENSKSLKDWYQRTLFPFTVGDNYLSSILLGRE